MTHEAPPHARDRHRMVEHQLARRGIIDERVLCAMRDVERHRFVSPDDIGNAYADMPLPIESGQTISQPFMVATMLEAAAIVSGNKVLEVGTGSGYVAALLCLMTTSVFTIERDAALFETARRRLGDSAHVRVRHGDGAAGWPEAAPFDVILVAASPAEIPPALKDQLAIGGRLILPIGDRISQRLVKLMRLGEEEFRDEDLGPVMFVPLL